MRAFELCFDSLEAVEKLATLLGTIPFFDFSEGHGQALELLLKQIKAEIVSLEDLLAGLPDDLEKDDEM